MAQSSIRTPILKPKKKPAKAADGTDLPRAKIVFGKRGLVSPNPKAKR